MSVSTDVHFEKNRMEFLVTLRMSDWRTYADDSILHAGIGGAGGGLAGAHGKPYLEKVEGVEEYRGGRTPAHARHQVLHPGKLKSVLWTVSVLV